jgi:class 3 adenylate cyclase
MNAQEFKTRVSRIFGTTWDSRTGQVVPKSDDVNLSNGAVRLDAVLLYADLAHSTTLAQQFPRSVAAKVVRGFLSSMAQLITQHRGHVRSFDGDRVMGVFVGSSKNSNAASCALRMNHIVTTVLRPLAEEKFPSLTNKGFTVSHCVGVHASDVLVVRGGVRGSNDLVFIGSSPNIAAKLSDIRNPPWHSYITKEVYSRLNDDARLHEGHTDMWTPVSRRIGDQTWSCYKSNWRWSP